MTTEQDRDEWNRELLSVDRQAERERLVRDLGVTVPLVGERLGVYAMVFRFPHHDGVPAVDVGQDEMEGLATVIAIGGALISGSESLLRVGNQYAAWALIRQLVEVEYLAWAFAHDRRRASEWLLATPQERRRFWQPSHLRQASDGRFGSRDYAIHCEFGGHPTPHSRHLLPSQITGPVEVGWHELCFHGDQVWRHIVEALTQTEIGSLALTSAPGFDDVTTALEAWETHDRLRAMAPSAVHNGGEDG